MVGKLAKYVFESSFYIKIGNNNNNKKHILLIFDVNMINDLCLLVFIMLKNIILNILYFILL